MATSTTSRKTNAPKAPKAPEAPKAPKADQVHEGLLGMAIAAGENVEAIEFDLVQEFAKVVTAGKLSVNGFKATVKAAKSAGAAFAYISEGMAQHIETIANLAAADTEARTMTLGQLSTLAVRMAKTAKPADKKTTKQEQARISSAALKRKAAGQTDAVKAKALADLAAKTETAWKALQGNKSEGNKSGAVTTTALTAASVNAMAELVRKAQGKFTDELASALTDLGVVIEIWLNADNN